MKLTFSMLNKKKKKTSMKQIMLYKKQSMISGDLKCSCLREIDIL